jgi:uncharacterized protein YkwD
LLVLCIVLPLGAAAAWWFFSFRAPTGDVASPASPVTPAPIQKTDPTPEPEPKSDPKPEPTPKVEPKAEPKAEPEPPPKAEPKPESGTALETAEKFLASINEGRQAAGLDPVTLDPELSQGCTAHAQYLVKNVLLRTLPQALDEDPSQPGFSEPGKKAAQASLVWFETKPASTASPVAAWLAAPADRVRLLDPALKRVGYASARDARRQAIHVLDVNRGRGSPRKPIVFPFDKQEGLPLGFNQNFCGLNRPAGAGLPVVVTFPTGVVVKNVTASLKGEGDEAVAADVFSPEKPADPNDRRNMVCLVPTAPLKEKTTYTATVTADLDGKPWTQTWSFTTLEILKMAREKLNVALEHLNHFRKQAGVEPAKLDEALVAGCMAHALYLVRNANHPSTQGLGGHNEDPKLPGYTKEGEKAGHSSVIQFGPSTDPRDGVDGLMNTLYHRVDMIRPDVKRVGIGFVSGKCFMIDVTSGREPPAAEAVVIYPADKQKDVEMLFPGNELPDPIPEDKDRRAGYPITAQFPDRAKVTDATGSLKDAKGKKIEIWFSSPQKPANPPFAMYQKNTMCIFAQDPLAPGMTYTVEMSASMDGKPWQKTWSFTTMALGEPGPDLDAKACIEIDKHRTALGLELALQHPVLAKASAEFARDQARKQKSTARLRNKTEAFIPFYLDPLDVIERYWLMRWDTRAQLLDADLKKVSFQVVRDDLRWRIVLGMQFAGEQIVSYPADLQTDVPRSTRPERVPIPDAARAAGVIGYPFTITFPEGSKLQNISATLKDEAGTAIDAWHSQVKLPIGGKPREVIVVAAKKPLKPMARYTIDVSATLDDQPWTQTSSFTTTKD